MNYCKDIYLLELTNHMNDSGQLSSIDFMNDLNSDIKRIKDKENRTIATDSLRIVILLTNFLNLSIEIIIL